MSILESLLSKARKSQDSEVHSKEGKLIYSGDNNGEKVEVYLRVFVTDEPHFVVRTGQEGSWVYDTRIDIDKVFYYLMSFKRQEKNNV